MNVHNRDLQPSDEIKAMFTQLGTLIANSQIDEAFSCYEKRAVTAKIRYHYIGRFGMAFVLISTFYTVAESLVIPTFQGERFVSAIAIAVGIVGLGLQAFLFASHAKQRWLMARFGAERVRSIAFQAYSLVQAATDISALENALNDFYTQSLAKLQAELNTGPAALDLYVPSAALMLPSVPNKAQNQELVARARQAFVELRLTYQQRYASSENLRLEENGRVGESLSDFLYLTGGVLAIAALCVKLALPDHANLSAWIDFTAVTAFIFGLSKVVFDAASNGIPSRDRYSRYLAQLTTISNDLTDNKMTLIDLVRRTEQAALEELGQFCQSASRTSYRL